MKPTATATWSCRCGFETWIEKQTSKCPGNPSAVSSIDCPKSQVYQPENKGDNLKFGDGFGLRKSPFRSTMSAVRRFFVFLQYGTSARLAAPLNRTFARRCVDAEQPGGKKSSPRPLPFDWNPDGMEQKPFELRQMVIAEGHRVRRRSIRLSRVLRSQGAV
jgi:hypothetical protein